LTAKSGEMWKQVEQLFDGETKLMTDFRQLFTEPPSAIESVRRETGLTESTAGSRESSELTWVTGNDPSVSCVAKIGAGDVTEVYEVLSLDKVH
jgi:hypothetical protein